MSNATTTDLAASPKPGWRSWLLPVLILTLLTVAISLPVYYYRVLTPTENDYGTHILFTLKMLHRQLPPTFVLAHPLLELIIGFIYWAGRGLIGLWETAVLVQVLAQVATALILFFWIGAIPGRSGAFLRVFFALTLTLVGPVTLLAPLDGRFYFGYIGLANYHNPTIHLLRPFALACFYFAWRAFHTPRNPGWMVVLSAGLMVAATLVKPNYAMTILPALAALAAWFFYRRRPLDLRMLIWGQAVPAVLMLAFATVLIYFVPDADKAGLTIAPFAVEMGFSGYLFPKFMLSILFPLGAVLLAFRWLRRDSEMLLAWAAFISGALQVYLLAETGERFFHGNFRWSAQIGLFILFAATVRFILRRRAAGELSFGARWILYAFYALHLAGGLAYYIYAITQPHYG
jgi:hypothetical protein